MDVYKSYMIWTQQYISRSAKIDRDTDKKEKSDRERERERERGGERGRVRDKRN